MVGGSASAGGEALRSEKAGSGGGAWEPGVRDDEVFGDTGGSPRDEI
jgi:hypothetical protein